MQGIDERDEARHAGGAEVLLKRFITISANSLESLFANGSRKASPAMALAVA